MNCDSLRNRLLALEDPTSIPDGLSVHLRDCSACTQWHSGLVLVDHAISVMPVPPAGNRKSELLAQFRSAKLRKPRTAAPTNEGSVEASPATSRYPKPARTSTPDVSPARPVTLGERLARMWPLGLVAAALLVATVAWSLLGNRRPPDAMLARAPADPMLTEIVAATVEVDRAHNPAQRVQALAKLADTIHDSARTLARVTPEEMASLASMYRKIVEEGLIPQARSLGDDERRANLPRFAQRLGEAEQEATRLAGGSPAGSDRALRDIAEAARVGRIELAKLIQGRAT